MNKDEALRLALEALENSVDLVREDAYNAEQLYGNYPARQGKVRGLKVLADDHEKAITAIKEALAQPEPNYKKALEVWLDKTEWVQETVKPHELGMHRADVLKQRIEEASPQRTWEKFCDSNCVWTDHHPDCKLAHPEQEPVAIFKADLDGGYVDLLAFQGQPLSDNTLLYTTPPQTEEKLITVVDIEKIVKFKERNT